MYPQHEKFVSLVGDFQSLVSVNNQNLHICSQRKRREPKNEEIAASEGAPSQNVGQTSFA